MPDKRWRVAYDENASDSQFVRKAVEIELGHFIIQVEREQPKNQTGDVTWYTTVFPSGRMDDMLDWQDKDPTGSDTWDVAKNRALDRLAGELARAIKLIELAKEKTGKKKK